MEHTPVSVPPYIRRNSVPLIPYESLKEREMERAADRQRVLLRHLQPLSCSDPPCLTGVVLLAQGSICAATENLVYQRSNGFDDDVVIVAACRTAICKANKGGFKDAHAEDLLAPLLEELLQKTKVNPNEVGDIIVGTVLAPGSQRAIECRMAAFYAETVPLRTVNRQCSSGLQAVADVAAAIKAGYYDIGIGAGLESMTLNKVGWEGSPNPKAKYLQQVQDCYLPMGVTSENVAERYGITKEEQDQAAVVSHKRAAAAIASGKFKEEIVPVTTKIMDPKTGVEKVVTVSMDEGVRPNTSLSDLAKLKPAFKKGGSTTAGNASQLSDGAGAVLLMRRDVAIRKGLPILGIFRSFAAIGVDPAVMGIGPAFAIPAAVRAAGLQIKDIDLYEINEAFASQYVYCIKELGLDPEKVNVNGGAIALGHPLGATGFSFSKSVGYVVTYVAPVSDQRDEIADFSVLKEQVAGGIFLDSKTGIFGLWASCWALEWELQLFLKEETVDRFSNVQIAHS
ncbi:3-ketoacyl-CoA thiolase 1, peroxisomal [Dendrobium catenatum]|uniref:acetyl-CoA C-acyltransferase n=1 Tax=Dendrobium catenatum TaxID=906689 RepID=A0A2I0WII8_9ASPA|nr:3-ketoacyl-CoA thiolase 1, peroxisomal [Dendrobium catenatum]